MGLSQITEHISLAYDMLLSEWGGTMVVPIRVPVF